MPNPSTILVVVLKIMFVPDPDNPKRSRQLMILWSTKETPAIRVNGYWWKPGSRMSIDEMEDM